MGFGNKVNRRELENFQYNNSNVKFIERIFLYFKPLLLKKKSNLKKIYIIAKTWRKSLVLRDINFFFKKWVLK